MIRPVERLIAHHEGYGRLLSDRSGPLPVRYFLDTWRGTIAAGTRVSAEMQRRDGFIWWYSAALPGSSCLLETEDGNQIRVSLYELNANRAHFLCVR